VLVQVNASFFVYPQTAEMALMYLRKGKIHFMGSDCHNMSSRPPNLAAAAEIMKESSALGDFARFNERIYSFLGRYL